MIPAFAGEDGLAIAALPDTATAEEAVAVIREVHDESVAAVMAEPAGPLHTTIRGYGSGLPWRPPSGLAEE